MVKIIKTVICVGVDKTHQQSRLHKHCVETLASPLPPPLQSWCEQLHWHFLSSLKMQLFPVLVNLLLDFQKMPVTLVSGGLSIVMKCSLLTTQRKKLCFIC